MKVVARRWMVVTGGGSSSKGITWKLKAGTDCLIVNDPSAGPANGASFLLSKATDGRVEALVFQLGPGAGMQVRWQKLPTSSQTRSTPPSIQISQKKNLYQILGVERDVSSNELKKAFYHNTSYSSPPAPYP